MTALDQAPPWDPDDQPLRPRPAPAGGPRVAPHSIQAEESLLGAMLLNRDAIDVAQRAVTADDFFSAVNGIVFEAVVSLWQRGSAVDPITVGDELGEAFEQFGGHAKLVGYQQATPSARNAAHYARIVVEKATLRRLIEAAGKIGDAGYEADDAAAAIDDARRALDQVHAPVVGIPDGLESMTDLLHRPASAQSPWVIPGQLRQDWRLVIVAGEGSGKSVMSRQIAMCAAQGVNPFTQAYQPAVNTLLLDLENPEEAIKETGVRIEDELVKMVGDRYREDGCWIMRRPGGLNLRDRRARAELEAALEHVQPSLVIISPLYKAYERGPRESDEDVAADIQRTIDSLRTRHGFATIIEHHAPKGEKQSNRDMVPFGSSMWLRWPEFGFGLRASSDGPPGSLEVGRWRGDRLKAAWPRRFERSGHGLPWMSVFPDNLWASFGYDGLGHEPPEHLRPTTHPAMHDDPTSF